MTLSLPVVLILATLWMLPAVVVALACGPLAGSTAGLSSETTTVVKGLRADVKDLDVDARKSAWRRECWSGPYASVKARITDASHEVMVLTPYAEASVTVGLVEDVRERRRCSLCLN